MRTKKLNFGILAVAYACVGLIQGNAFAIAAETTPVVAACAVPVCDLPAELARLRSMPANSRFQAISAFRNAYSRTQELAILQNLSEYAVAVEPLFVELQVEDYVLREVRTLGGEMLVGLAKYSPLHAATLAGFYTQLRGEDARYSILTFWRDRISQYEDKTSLLELMDFFSQIGTISRASGNSDYLSRDARGAEDTITNRIVQLYPYFEGSYRVAVTCDDSGMGGALPIYCQTGFINRLVIMDTLGPGRLQVSLVNSQTGTTLYTFTEVLLSEGGTAFTATGAPSGISSQLRLVMDRHTGRLSGTIRNTDTLSTLRIEGELEQTPATVYDLQAANPNVDPVTADALNRSYQGRFSNRDVTLTLLSFGQGQFGATMAFADVPGYRLRFQFSRFYSKLGILVLVGSQANGSHLKLTMYFRPVGNRLEVTGMGFTDLNGGTQELSLQSPLP